MEHVNEDLVEPNIERHNDKMNNSNESVPNPWKVSSLDEFLFYNCPECDVKAKEKEVFSNHAIEKHHFAREVLTKNLHTEVFIKHELEEATAQQYSFKCELCQFSSNNSQEIIEHVQSHNDSLHSRKKSKSTKPPISNFFEENGALDCPYCFESLQPDAFHNHLEICYNNQNDYEAKPGLSLKEDNVDEIETKDLSENPGVTL